MLIPFREESAPNEAIAATQRAPQVLGGRTSQPGILQLRPPQMLIPFREESAPQYLRCPVPGFARSQIPRYARFPPARV